MLSILQYITSAFSRHPQIDKEILPHENMLKGNVKKGVRVFQLVILAYKPLKFAIK